MAKTSGISRETILEVAEAIISAKGVKDTSLLDIAKAVGISKGTLYYHYSSKETLVYDITGRHFDKVISRMMKMLDSVGSRMKPEEMLQLVLTDLVEQLHIDRLHLYLLHEVISGNVELKERYVERYREWRAMICSSLEKIFGIEHVAHEAAAGLLLSVIEGSTIRRIVLEDPIDYKAISRCIASMYQ